MRPPRPRFTLRWLMVAVAVAAVPFGGVAAVARSRHLAAVAWSHRDECLSCVAASGIPGRECGNWLLSIAMADEAGEWMEARSRASSAQLRLLRRWRYHRELARKYARAARYCWLPIAPDPPEPE